MWGLELSNILYVQNIYDITLIVVVIDSIEKRNMSRTSVGSIWEETSATFVEHARFAFLLSVDTYQQGNTERQSLKTIFTKDSISLGQMKTLAIFICNQYISYSIFCQPRSCLIRLHFRSRKKKLLKSRNLVMMPAQN